METDLIISLKMPPYKVSSSKLHYNDIGIFGFPGNLFDGHNTLDYINEISFQIKLLYSSYLKRKIMFALGL